MKTVLIVTGMVYVTRTVVNARATRDLRERTVVRTVGAEDMASASKVTNFIWINHQF
jgi:hypothetical protein